MSDNPLLRPDALGIGGAEPPPGFFASLTPEQKRKALAYRGDDSFVGCGVAELLIASGTLTRCRRWKIRPLCPLDRRPCRFPRCVVCHQPMAEWRGGLAFVLAMLAAGVLIGWGWAV